MSQIPYNYSQAGTPSGSAQHSQMLQPVAFHPPYPGSTASASGSGYRTFGGFPSQSLPPSFQHSMPIQIATDSQIANVQVKTGLWSSQERDALLEWLGRDLRNQELLKTKQKSTCGKIATEVFGGTRTGYSVRNQWIAMKQKYSDAKARLSATGEGQRDDMEKWTSIKLAWLDRLCPYFETMDDILQSDWAHTPLYVSEAGFEGSDPSDEEEGEESLHPPAGGQKPPVPMRKGDKTGEGKAGIKRRRTTFAEDAVDRLNQERIGIEEKRLKQEKEISDRSLNLAEEREKNRHEETMLRLRVQEKKFELQMQIFMREHQK